MIGWIKRRLENRKIEKLTLGKTAQQMTENLERRVEILAERAEARGVDVGNRLSP